MMSHEQRAPLVMQQIADGRGQRHGQPASEDLVGGQGCQVAPFLFGDQGGSLDRTGISRRLLSIKEGVQFDSKVHRTDWYPA
jgi:hypothetical protein